MCRNDRWAENQERQYGVCLTWAAEGSNREYLTCNYGDYSAGDWTFVLTCNGEKRVIRGERR